MNKNNGILKKKIRNFLKKEDKNNLGFSSLSPTVPLIVKESINYLEQNGLDLEGIFRIPGRPTEIKSLSSIYGKGKSAETEMRKMNTNSIASFLKLFLLELSDPLLTFELVDCWIKSISILDLESKLMCVRSTVELLPIGNRLTLDCIICFLLKVSKNSNVNKMSASNLGIAFGPCLMRNQDTVPLEIMLSHNQKSGQLVEFMINYYDQIFKSASLDKDKLKGSKGTSEFYQDLKRSSRRIASMMLENAFSEDEDHEIEDQSVNEVAGIL